MIFPNFNAKNADRYPNRLVVFFHCGCSIGYNNGHTMSPGFCSLAHVEAFDAVAEIEHEVAV